MACPTTKKLFKQASKLHKVAQQFGRCAYCGCRLVVNEKSSKSPRFATFDHAEPKAFDPRPGWQQTKVIACKRCNGLKGSKPLIVFLLQLNRMQQSG